MSNLRMMFQWSEEQPYSRQKLNTSHGGDSCNKETNNCEIIENQWRQHTKKSFLTYQVHISYPCKEIHQTKPGREFGEGRTTTQWKVQPWCLLTKRIGAKLAIYFYLSYLQKKNTVKPYHRIGQWSSSCLLARLALPPTWKLL